MKKRITYWEDKDVWLGYIDDYPDYMTQGNSFDELKENLKDIYLELTGGQIPFVRHTGELEIV